ncbi:MAG TPA: cytochrome c oxidase subunit 3 [Candidatus Eremiobacteraceae bacterium]|nr:cytochrome c oxidase subunit 3 [Candidatus Eremiobacteraceae bacterium]
MSESHLPIHDTGAAVMEASPYGIPSRKLTMWLFLVSDAVTFGAILFGYGYLRTASTDWPTPFKFNPSILNVMIMTAVLLTSSLTMLGAVDSAKTGDKPKTQRFLWSTILLGVVFAGLHIREWFGLIDEGVGLFQNPWGSPLFGATFFSITGLHLLHVISGVIAIAVISRGFARGSLTAGHVETTGLYWHFVDLVWMFVVPLLYLLNIARS